MELLCFHNPFRGDGAVLEFWSLIFFRSLQGLVGAAIFPTAMSIIAKTFRDKQERAQALGIWSASFAISAVLGPLVGGPLIDSFSWRMLFYINLPIGILGVIMVLAFLPDDSHLTTREKFDYKGAIVLALALSSLVLVLDKGQEWGWISLKSVIAYIVTIVSGIAFYFTEKKEENPLIDLNFFRNPVFVSAIAISFVAFSGMMGSIFLLPIFFQKLLNYNATETGYIFLPLALTMMVASPLGARIARSVNPRWSISFGMLVASLGVYLLSGLDPLTASSDLILPLMLLATGLGLGMAPLTNAVASSVPTREVGIASGVLNLTRNIAGAMGIAIFGTLLSNRIESNIFEVSANSVIHSAGPALTSILPGLVVFKAQVAAYGSVFVTAAFFMIGGALVALTLRESSKDYAEEKVEGEGDGNFAEI